MKKQKRSGNQVRKDQKRRKVSERQMSQSMAAFLTVPTPAAAIADVDVAVPAAPIAIAEVPIPEAHTDNASTVEITEVIPNEESSTPTPEPSIQITNSTAIETTAHNFNRLPGGNSESTVITIAIPSADASRSDDGHDASTATVIDTETTPKIVDSVASNVASLPDCDSTVPEDSRQRRVSSDVASSTAEDSRDSIVSHASSSIASTSSATPSTSNPDLYPDPNDIAIAILHPGGPNMLPDHQKQHLLETTMKPKGAPITWPYEFRSGTRRHLTLFCYEQYGTWLTYSRYYGGLFCKFCVFFAKAEDQVGQLVTLPCVKFGRLTSENGYLYEHNKAKYHGTSQLKSQNFIDRCKNHAEPITDALDKALKKQKAQNRKIITTIAQTVVLNGRMGEGYRGHRDDGPLSRPQSINDIVTHQGQFRTLLQVYSLSNDDLGNHLDTCSKNATYISKTIQNELIRLMGQSIFSRIAEEVREAKYFTILADETTDASRNAQLSISLRFVHDGCIVERFVSFVNPESLSGAGLANEILIMLQQLGVDSSHVVGQGYDGAAAMSSGGKGVHGVIKAHCGEQAVFVHCVAHALNLTLMKASEVPQIRNAFGTISKVATFFNTSTVRSDRLQKLLDDMPTALSKRSVKVPCQTRWVEKHEAVHTMYNLHSPVEEVLETMSTERGPASHDANSLLTSMSSTEFVVSLTILNEVMTVTKQLSTALQSAGNSLVATLGYIKTVRAKLQLWRNDDTRFKSIAAKAKTLLGVEELTVPRVTGRQTKRCNVPHSDPTDYYRKSIYLPFMDCLLSQFDSRFESHGKVVLLLCGLLPKQVQSTDFSDVTEGIKLYEHLLPGDIETIETEFEIWKLHCQQQKSSVDDCLAGLDMCPKAFYPNIHDLLKIYATLPVSTATPERTFSALKQIKGYLRTTMSEERLNGLALAYIYKDLNVQQTVDDMVRLFASENRRRLKF